ncbi:UNVERIFIED_CONTAM: putative RNA helicase [Siphonaria sp. JEL0065]|nr:putative RNA helicase [Siphonaria sp. JEL0065]
MFCSRSLRYPHTWNTLLPVALQPGIARLGIEGGPSAVQTASFDPIFRNKNVLIKSATGTGKTLAFVAPFFAKPGGQVLVLAPTVELLRQTMRVSAAFDQPASLLPFPEGIPKRQLNLNPRMFLSTPLGLESAATSFTGKTSQNAVRKGLTTLLKNTDAIVIDECDKIMADDKARAVVFAIKSVAKKMLNRNLQWILVAATLPTVSPVRDHILKLVPDVVESMDSALVMNNTPTNLKHSFIKIHNTEDETASKELLSKSEKDSLLERELEAKFNLLTEAIKLSQVESTQAKLNQWLVFCNEKGTVDFLVKHLALWCNEYGIASNKIQLAGVHKETPEEVKSSIVARFAAGKDLLTIGANAKQPTTTFQILVATDLVARGLDFPHVSKVFSFDFPQTVDAYLHRAGRTARKGGLGEGECVSFVGLFDKKVCEKVEEINALSIPEILDHIALHLPPDELCKLGQLNSRCRLLASTDALTARSVFARDNLPVFIATSNAIKPFQLGQLPLFRLGKHFLATFFSPYDLLMNNTRVFAIPELLDQVALYIPPNELHRIGQLSRITRHHAQITILCNRPTFAYTNLAIYIAETPTWQSHRLAALPFSRLGINYIIALFRIHGFCESSLRILHIRKPWNLRNINKVTKFDDPVLILFWLSFFGTRDILLSHCIHSFVQDYDQDDEERETILHNAFTFSCDSGDRATAEWILGSDQIDLTTWGGQVLADAARLGNIEIVEMVLEKVDSVDRLVRDGSAEVASSWAFENQHFDVIRVLVKAGIDVSKKFLEGSLLLDVQGGEVQDGEDVGGQDLGNLGVLATSISEDCRKNTPALTPTGMAQYRKTNPTHTRQLLTFHNILYPPPCPILPPTPTNPYQLGPNEERYASFLQDKNTTELDTIALFQLRYATSIYAEPVTEVAVSKRWFQLWKVLFPAPFKSIGGCSGMDLLEEDVILAGWGSEEVEEPTNWIPGIRAVLKGLDADNGFAQAAMFDRAEMVKWMLFRGVYMPFGGTDGIVSPLQINKSDLQKESVYESIAKTIAVVHDTEQQRNSAFNKNVKLNQFNLITPQGITTAMILSSKHPRTLSTLSLLLTHPLTDVNVCDGSPLAWCSRMGCLDGVKLLFAYRADPLIRNGVASLWAAGTYILLLKHISQNPNQVHRTWAQEVGKILHAQEEYCLRWAVARGHLETVRYLCKAGATVDAMEIIDELLAHGADVANASRAADAREGIDVEEGAPDEENSLVPWATRAGNAALAKKLLDSLYTSRTRYRITVIDFEE